MQNFTYVRRIALFFLSMVLSSGIVFAQEKTITGKVSAEGEGTMPGVNVTIQGTTLGAITDINGGYTIKVPGPAAVLVFSSVGYSTKQVTVGSQSVIDVVIVSDITALSEVVVTGYSTQRKKDITGAVSVVTPEKLTAIPSGQVSNQLQGRTSGVTVLGSGMPGETSRVRIRGFSSFQNNDPLYIVDGVPTQDISSMNPNDVESISVLKDAGAASIYGSRSSNGVIVVTTKKGSKGIKVNYDMYFGTQDPGKGPTNLLNTQEYADLQWLVYKNDGTVETNPIYGLSTNQNPTLPSWAANTNWYDAITNTAPIQNHDFSFSGGNDKSSFFAGFGYYDQEGIIIHTHTKRYSGRFNSEWNFLNNRVKVGENITMSYRSTLGVTNLGEASPIQMGPYRAQSIIPVIITTPIDGISHNYIPGEYGGTGIAVGLGNGSNAVADLVRAKDNQSYNLRVIGSAFMDVMILKGLNFRSTLGGTWNNGYDVNYTFATYENSENTSTPNLNESAFWGADWVWTNSITLDKVFGQHKILAVAGYEAVKYGIGRDMDATRSGYFTDAVNFRTLSNGVTISAADSYLNTPTSLVSMFLKADYGFMDKYLLSATVRRDGSSRFGKTNQYGVFPSFGVGWRISNESFMKGIGWISDLKIRGSYGTMGNQLAVSPQNQFSLYGGSSGSSNYDLNGAMSSSLQGFRADRIGNPDAKWETNITTNIGFEGRLFNSKVGIVFDWYTKQTKELLFDPEIVGTVGSASPPYINIASMSNKGIDMELSYKNNWGDFGFNGSLTLTTYKNEITKIAKDVTFFDPGIYSRVGDLTRNMEGQPMSAFYGYQVIGLFQDTIEVKNAPVQDGAAPGYFRFANKITNTALDTLIDPGDRMVIGNPNPKFTYGLNLAFTWKNFDLSAFIYGSDGNDIYNWNRYFTDFWPSFQGQKSKDLLYNSWTPTNTGAKTPIASNTSTFSSNTQSTSYYIENGSFLRLKSLQIGYTFPERIMSKIKVRSLRIYVQGVNLFTSTKYTGLDPELSGDDTNFGIDYGNYPIVKQYLFGLNVGF